MDKPTPRSDVFMKLWTSSAAISRKIDLGLGAIHGIGFTEYMVLLQLANAPGGCMRRTELAESISRTPSGVTRMLMPMEKIGLVEKQSNPRDARVSLVKITEAGRRIYGEASDTLNSHSERLLGRMEDHEITSLLKSLNAITRA
jgi:DNA-binding MarR family transcriptional regulator